MAVVLVCAFAVYYILFSPLQIKHKSKRAFPLIRRCDAFGEERKTALKVEEAAVELRLVAAV